MTRSQLRGCWASILTMVCLARAVSSARGASWLTCSPRRGEDLDWYIRFMSQCAKTVRRSTLRLVASLDLRGFAVDAQDVFYEPDRSLSESFRNFVSLFPRLRCIQLDGHPKSDPWALNQPRDPGSLAASDFEAPLLLSIAGCLSTPLLDALFNSTYFRSLVYLDISGIQGSIRGSLIYGSLRPLCLPALRVLKSRGRKMPDNIAILLLDIFMLQLWCLDLSGNNLTDAVITRMIIADFPDFSLQTDAHFDTEGRLTLPKEAGSYEYGSFRFIDESEWSGSFTHPHRHLVDSPVYYPDADRPPQDAAHVRSDGRAQIRQSGADAIKCALAGRVGFPGPDEIDVHHLDICQDHGGITHLALNQNGLTITGLEQLLLLSGGHLQHLECGGVLSRGETTVLPGWLSKPAQVKAVLGISHLLRPLISSNLRSLSIHHSLVTQIPTLVAQNVSTMSALWLSETFLRPRAELAFPQPFMPDMNPRIQFLALTNLPRYSTGPLIVKLITFLDLAHKQEQDIAQATGSSRRSPSVLSGLRHIRLEFEAKPSLDSIRLANTDEIDAGALMRMDPAANQFSFFGGGWDSSPTATIPSRPGRSPSEQTSIAKGADLDSGRLGHHPFPGAQGEYVQHSGQWHGKVFTIPVWVGPGTPGPHDAVNEYMRNLEVPALRTNVRPVSPGQILAGVPAGSYVFNAAWAAIFSCPDMRRPTWDELEGMRDVVSEIQQYRARTKTTGRGYWTGRLELVLESGTANDFWQ